MKIQNQKGFIIPLIIVVMAVAVLGTGGYFTYKQYAAPKPVACAQEAKLCPDGSYVSRTGPNCEFTQCPETPADQSTDLPDQNQQATEDWKTYTNSEYGFEIKYPVDWSVDQTAALDRNLL